MEIASKKHKSWKSCVNGLVNVKRPNSVVSWPSPENKKQRLLSPIKQSHDVSHLSPSKQAYSHSHLSPQRVARQLKLVDEGLDAEGSLEAMEEDLSAGAGGQPCRHL